MFLKTQNDIANLKKLEQVRTEFLGNVSHELRTPIFAIQGFFGDPGLTVQSMTLRSTKLFLRRLFLHTENLSTLLNELIDISMIESGQMRMSFRYFNIREFLEGIIKETSANCRKEKVSSRIRRGEEKD